MCMASFHVKKTILFWSCYWIFGLKPFSGFLCDNVNINVMVCVCLAASVVFHLRCVCSAGWGSKVRKPLSSDAQEKQHTKTIPECFAGMMWCCQLFQACWSLAFTDLTG